MNPTKNVRYIEVENDVFEQLCEYEYDQKVKDIQKNYGDLCHSIAKQMGKWMKIKDKECYFNSVAKVLFPDTRRLIETDLRLHVSNSYADTVNYLNGCNEDTKEIWKKQADESELLLPSGFDSEVGGFSAIPLSVTKLEELFDDKSCPCFDTEGNLEVRNGTTTRIICDYSLPIYNIKSRRYSRCGNNDKALKISIHEFNDNLSPIEIIIKYKLYGETFDELLIEQINSYSDILENGIDVNDFVGLKSYLKNGSKKYIGTVDLRKEAIENDVEVEEIDLYSTEGLGMHLKQYFDCCDYMRARIQRYNSKWYLSDEGKGHWELWGAQEELPAKRILRKKIKLRLNRSKRRSTY